MGVGPGGLRDHRHPCSSVGRRRHGRFSHGPASRLSPYHGPEPSGSPFQSQFPGTLIKSQSEGQKDRRSRPSSPLTRPVTAVGCSVCPALTRRPLRRGPAGGTACCQSRCRGPHGGRGPLGEGTGKRLGGWPPLSCQACLGRWCRPRLTTRGSAQSSPRASSVDPPLCPLPSPPQAPPPQPASAPRACWPPDAQAGAGAMQPSRVHGPLSHGHGLLTPFLPAGRVTRCLTPSGVRPVPPGRPPGRGWARPTTRLCAP